MFLIVVISLGLFCSDIFLQWDKCYILFHKGLLKPFTMCPVFSNETPRGVATLEPQLRKQYTIILFLAFIEQLLHAGQCSRCSECLLFIQSESSVTILQVKVAQITKSLPQVNYIVKYRTWSPNPDLSSTYLIITLLYVTHTPHYLKKYFPKDSTYTTDGNQKKFYTMHGYIFILMSIRKNIETIMFWILLD